MPVGWVRRIAGPIRRVASLRFSVALSFLGLTCVTCIIGRVMPTGIKNDRWHEFLPGAVVTQRASGFFILFQISTEQTGENWGFLLLARELPHKRALNRETATMNALRQRSTSAEHRRLTVVATVALLGLVAISTTARADILTTFDFSGTLSGSPNANPPTVTGTFALDQTTGTLAGVDLNTPIGAFTGSTFDGIDSSLWQTVSGGTAFQLIYEGDGGIVGLSLGFAGTVDGFTGGSLLTQADFLQPGLPPQLSNPSGLESDSFVPACDGSTAGFELTGGVATPVTAPAVPEPGSLAFFGTGLVALASTLRTRRRSQPTADGE